MERYLKDRFQFFIITQINIACILTELYRKSFIFYVWISTSSRIKFLKFLSHFQIHQMFCYFYYCKPKYLELYMYGHHLWLCRMIIQRQNESFTTGWNTFAVGLWFSQSFPLGKKLQTHFKYKVIISMFFQNSKMIDNNT